MQLTATKRDTSKKPAALRREGLLPAVIYGPKEAATPITLNAKEFSKLFATAGESTVITIAGLGEEKDALIHEVSVDPVRGQPIHADFYAIEKGKPVTVSVPLSFDGVSPAVKDLGGILVKVMHQLEIEVLPKELPQQIVIDLAQLKEIGSQIQVKDIALPKSAHTTADAEEVIAMVSAAKEEVEAAPVDVSQIEVSVEKGKKEEEEVPAAE
jgi:large subunit ribosomal protein L25